MQLILSAWKGGYIQKKVLLVAVNEAKLCLNACNTVYELIS